MENEMKITLRVNPKTHLVCIPNSMVEEGMVGDIESFANTVTLTLVSSGASLEDVKASLETVLKDIELRMRIESKNGRSTRSS
jgi:hypothetical protein